MTQTLKTILLLSTLVTGAMSFAPVSAETPKCDINAAGECSTLGTKKIGECQGDRECMNRWTNAMVKCQCDAGCTTSNVVSCEVARKFCEGDTASNRCDDLRKK